MSKCSRSALGWQAGFVKLLPQIERLLKRIYRRLDGDHKDEAVQNAVVHCLLSYVRLHAKGRARSVTASTLVWYATLQRRCGRAAVEALNSFEPLSEYAQLRRGFMIRSLHRYDSDTACWLEELIDDQRASVADIVATRMDFHAWLSKLSWRTRSIALDLARGCSTAETARMFRVTASRISQIRRSLEESWKDFQSDASRASAC